MSTRSDIIAQFSNLKWGRIYCHWDGYLAHNGKILFEHYTDQKKVESLIMLGDLSILGPEIGKKHKFDWNGDLYDRHKKKLITDAEYEKLQAKGYEMCTAYKRDRGEKGTDPTIRDTLAQVWPEEDTWTEFTYVWRDGAWLVGDPDEGTQTLVNLGDALLGKKIITPKVKMFGGAILGKHLPHDPKDPDSHKWASNI